MVWIGDHHCILVEEHCPGFFEGNPVLPDVLRVFPIIPLEAEHVHQDQCNYNVRRVQSL